MQAKITHITQTDPHICLQERVTQTKPKMTLYDRRKLHLFFSNCVENAIKEVQTSNIRKGKYRPATTTTPAPPVSRSGYPPWILKRAGLESSG